MYRIVIGEKYHFESFLIECICPYCGHNLGGGTEVGRKADVIVLATARDYRKENGYEHCCAGCGRDLPDQDGWYAVQRLSYPFDSGCAPYTQLTPIQEVNNVTKTS